MIAPCAHRLFLHAGALDRGASAWLLPWGTMWRGLRRALLLPALLALGACDGSEPLPPPAHLDFVQSREWTPGVQHTPFTKALAGYHEIRVAFVRSRSPSARRAAVDAAHALLLLAEKQETSLRLLDESAIPSAEPLSGRALFIFHTHSGAFSHAIQLLESTRSKGEEDLPTRDRLLRIAERVHEANRGLIAVLSPDPEPLGHLVGLLRSAPSEPVKPESNAQ